jgi:uncharacterized RDD family membrane protein YckC
MNNPQDYLASRRKRFFGAMCDSLISLAVIMPIMWATGIFKQVSAGEQLSLEQTLMFFILGWIVFIILHGYLLATQGQTIGKRIIGTRIVGLDGQILSLSKLLCLRYLIFGAIGQIPIVGGAVQLTNILLIFGKNKQCLHDKLASTLVIDSSMPLATIEAEVI